MVWSTVRTAQYIGIVATVVELQYEWIDIGLYMLTMAKRQWLCWTEQSHGTTFNIKLQPIHFVTNAISIRVFVMQDIIQNKCNIVVPTYAQVINIWKKIYTIQPICRIYIPVYMNIGSIQFNNGTCKINFVHLKNYKSNSRKTIVHFKQKCWKRITCVWRFSSLDLN